MEIRYYLRMMQRGWWLILLSILVAVNSSLIYSYFFAIPMYESSARFIVSPNIQNFEAGKDLANSLATLDKRSIITTYAEIVNSNQIFEGNLELFGLQPIDFLDYEVSVVVLPDTNILQLTVLGPNPEVVAFLANSTGHYAIDYIVALYQVYEISFIDTAIVPIEPYIPRPFQDAVIAFFIGALIGIGLAVLRDQLASSLQRFSLRRMTDGESLAYSRTYFERYLRDEIAAQPENEFSLGLIYLNGIQDIYDSLPQAYINHVMRTVTETLKYQLRGNDVVGRWSRLSFIVLLSTTPGLPAANTLDRIREMLDQPLSLDLDGEIKVELDPRVGVASFQKGELFGDLVAHTEQALENARQSEEKINLFKSNGQMSKFVI